MFKEKSDTSLVVQKYKMSHVGQVLPVVRLSSIALVGYFLVMSRRIVWVPRHDQFLGRIRLRRADTLGP